MIKLIGVVIVLFLIVPESSLNILQSNGYKEQKYLNNEGLIKTHEIKLKHLQLIIDKEENELFSSLKDDQKSQNNLSAHLKECEAIKLEHINKNNEFKKEIQNLKIKYEHRPINQTLCENNLINCNANIKKQEMEHNTEIAALKTNLASNCTKYIQYQKQLSDDTIIELKSNASSKQKQLELCEANKQQLITESEKNLNQARWNLTKCLTDLQEKMKDPDNTAQIRQIALDNQQSLGSAKQNQFPDYKHDTNNKNEFSKKRKSLPTYCLPSSHGRQKIRLSNNKEIYVLCNNRICGPGWMVIQKRTDESQDFDKTWDEYVQGFGTDDFFLGLEYLHLLTNAVSHELYIYFKKETSHSHYYVLYDNFSIGSKHSHYTLESIGTHIGQLDDALRNNLLKSFSTKNHDITISRCPNSKMGGWWYPDDVDCGDSNLNGPFSNHMRWGNATFNKVIMMIRPKNYAGSRSG